MRADDNRHDEHPGPLHQLAPGPSPHIAGAHAGYRLRAWLSLGVSAPRLCAETGGRGCGARSAFSAGRAASTGRRGRSPSCRRLRELALGLPWRMQDWQVAHAAAETLVPCRHFLREVLAASLSFGSSSRHSVPRPRQDPLRRCRLEHPAGRSRRAREPAQRLRKRIEDLVIACSTSKQNRR